MNLLSSDLKQFLQDSRRQKKNIVLVTGVFDILHVEHVNFLKKAKQAGDVLIVGLETDQRVRQIKGEGRPVHMLAERIKNLQVLAIADRVFGLPEQFSSPEVREQFIAEIRPNILAVSSHSPNQPQKAKTVEKYGGKLQIVHQYNPAFSTTQILSQEKITS